VPSTDHRAKFHAGRPTHLGDLEREKKNITRKTLSPSENYRFRAD